MTGSGDGAQRMGGNGEDAGGGIGVLGGTTEGDERDIDGEIGARRDVETVSAFDQTGAGTGSSRERV